MEVLILGSNSAAPAYGRYPSAQVINIREQLFLLDCGEGAQMRMQEYKVKRRNLHHIFISHLHGDHFFGLIGFLNSMALLGRETPMHIYAPKKLKDILELQLEYELSYPIHYHFLEAEMETILVDTESVRITAFPVFHSIPTHGFLFVQKEKKRILLPDELRKYEIPKYFYPRLSAGEDYQQKNGEVIQNDWVTSPGKQEKKYAYTADTAPHEKYMDIIMGVDLLYHEATYTEKYLDKAVARKHSTAQQAAQVALQAGVGKLIIGHFSSRYKVLDDLLSEAVGVFPNTVLAVEGESFRL